MERQSIPQHFKEFKSRISNRLVETKKTLSRRFGEITWDITDHFKLGVRNLENVNLVNKHLESGGNVILIHNHPGTPDPLFILKIGNEFLSSAKVKGYFGSSKFFDGRLLDFGLMEFLQSLKNTQFWKVLQPNDTEGLERLSERNKKTGQNITPDGINASAIKNALRMLRKRVSSLIMICPQGTRSPVMLEPSESIIDILERVKENTLIFPVQISGSEKILPKGKKVPRLLERATLTALPPISYQQIMKRSEILGITPTHAMMLDIAVNTDPKYWGVHTQDISRLLEITGRTDPIKALKMLDDIIK